MDLLGDLVGGQACAADGTTAARNPLSRLVDTLMEGSAGQQQQHKGRTRRAAPQFVPHQQGAAPRGGMMMRVRPPPETAASIAAARAHAESSAAAAAHWAGPRHAENARQQGPALLSQDADNWAHEFGPHGHVPHEQLFGREFESAWGAGVQPPPPHPAMVAAAAAAAASEGGRWAHEFQREPGMTMMMGPHPAELEAAWAAQRGFEVGAGFGMPPPLPHARASMGAPFRQGSGGFDQDDVIETPGLGESARDGGSGTNKLRHFEQNPPLAGVGADSRGIDRVGGTAESSREMSASAAALAREMASDRDGLFAESELLQFVSGLGTGRLAVSEDKVVRVPDGAVMEEAWTAGCGAGAEGSLEAAWRGEGKGVADDHEQQPQGQASQSFSDAWAGLDSGVGVREEPSLKLATSAGATLSSAQDEAWSAVGGTAAASSASKGSLRTGDEQQQRSLEETMEAAWEEAKAGMSTSSIDPDLQAVWDDQDVNTLDGVWSRTAARLEAGETGIDGGNTRLETPYELSENNKFSDVSDPFEQGVRLFEEGQIADAVLCFEAEIARNSDNSQAWFMLGQSHAENDQDRLAISCLERAVEMDPYGLDALLALGTSYVNELDSQRALHNLKAWVQHNPKYAGLEITVDEYSDGTLMDEVMQLMLQAQRWDPADADAQVVLGVLYNVSRDYDSAVEAFRRALDARPNDHSLWNKLGATLANHRRSEEALPAYRRAIASKPGYARAWLNMGISQANLNHYDEASACYLQALRLNPDAKHIWSYLRIVFTCMERFDLVQKAGQEDAALFQDDFDLTRPAPP